MAVAPTDQAAGGASATRRPAAGRAYERYVLFLLTLTLVFSLIDRQVVNILAEPIRQALGLKDWQIGLLSGFAFAIFYASFGLPVAWLAERRSRPAIIAGSLATWALFTAAGGLARSFGQLLIARTGVGIGEAGCIPPAHALISDYFPRERRATALAVYHLGVPIGGLLGLAFGGIIADAYGWRAAFAVVGLPGVAVAALVLLTLKERGRTPGEGGARQVRPLGEVLRLLRAKRSFWLVALGAGTQAFIAYGHAPFSLVFFLRAHGRELAILAAPLGLKPAGFLGLAMGLISGVAGIFGTLLGGLIADRAGRHDPRAYCVIPALASIAATPFAIAAFLAPATPVALLLAAVPALFNSLWLGPVYAIEQGVAPPAMRATTSAILLFILNSIGLGLGPLCVGLLSDGLAAKLGPADGVRWALVLTSLLSIVVFALFWAARSSVADDLWTEPADADPPH